MNEFYKKGCIVLIWLSYFAISGCIVMRDYAEFFKGFVSSLSIPVLYSLLTFHWLCLGQEVTYKMDAIKNDTLTVGLAFLFFSFAALVVNSNHQEQGVLWSFTLIFFGLYGLVIGFVFSIINTRFRYKKEHTLVFAYLLFFVLWIGYESWEMTYIKTIVDNKGYLFVLNSIVSLMLMSYYLYSLLFREKHSSV